MKTYSAHETAIIDEGALISPGVQIWHFSHVMPGASLGANSKVGQNVFIDRDVCIGQNVKIQNNVSVYRGVSLADNVFVGPSVVFTNVFSPRSRFPKNPDEYLKTHIGEGATLGANSTIVCGVSVGEHAFVGAGSVVTKNVPPFALVYGIPASLKGWVCICGQKLPSASRGPHKIVSCRTCGESYRSSKSKCQKI
ncbi:MAG: N-acetyltransferase [Candidatus Omnitrophica bacterium]|nr:N-acetyltransferase [Candidatus Omnitrophota bacterium]